MTKRYTIPPTARRALAWATRHDPLPQETTPAKRRRRRRRAPLEWPPGSMFARQTSILKWLESLGHEVDYTPETPMRVMLSPEPRNRIKPTMSAVDTSAFLKRAAEAKKR